MSDREQFEAARAAGLKARHETRVERAIRRQVAEEIAVALEAEAVAEDATADPEASWGHALRWAARTSREIGAKETS